MMRFKSVLLSALLMFVTMGAQAADTLLKPFVLASKGVGTVAEKSAQVKSVLAGSGFTVVGDYAPYAGAEIIIVTNDVLKKNAAASENGGYGAVQRVAVTEAGQLYQSGIYGECLPYGRGFEQCVSATGGRTGQDRRVRFGEGHDREAGAQIPLHDRYGIFR